MARLASQEKMGFFPFDMRYMDALTSMFSPAKGKILDPFAGEGEAIEAFAKKLNLTPYANELDKPRADICIQKFGALQAVNEDAENLRASESAFVAIFNNPPYAEEILVEKGEEHRKELKYLKLAKKWLQPNGYMIWVVYDYHLSERAASYIAKNYSTCDVYYIPEKHLGEYKQVVVVMKNGGKTILSTQDVLDAKENMRVLEVVSEPLYKFPEPNNSKRFTFAARHTTSAQILAALEKTSAFSNGRFQDSIKAKPILPELKPLRQPRDGQMALILATGLFNGLILEDKDGRKMAVRSTVRHVERTVDTQEYADKSVEIRHIKPETTITLLYEDGTLDNLEGDSAIVEFIKAHHHTLIEYFNEHYQPLYQNDYSEFAHVLNSIRVKGKHELFEEQKHAIAAVTKKLLIDNRAVLVGEMGTGKTIISTSIMKILHDQFSLYADDHGNLYGGQIVLIVCPGTLLYKWQREILDAYPDSHVVVLRDDPASKTKKTYSSLEKAAALLRHADSNPLQLHVGIMNYETAKNGEIKHPAVHWRTRPAKEEWEHYNYLKAEYETKWRWKEKDGKIQKDFYPHCPTTGEKIFLKGKSSQIVPKKTFFEAEPRFNETGNQKYALWQELRSFKKSKVDGAVSSFGEWFKDISRYNGNIHTRVSKWTAPRYALSNFFTKAGKGRIGLLIVDELHEAKDEVSDVHGAVERLVHAADKTLGLTGTLFGGKSSSVFYLEHMFNPHWMNKYFPYKGGMTDWQKTMGVIEKVLTTPVEKGDGYSGRYTGRTRKQLVTTREISGISPMLVKAILDHCVFLGMSDLKDDMPDYQDIEIPIEMSSDMADIYEPLQSFLKDYLMDCLEERDNSFMAAYLRTLIAWPSAPFRGGEVIHRKKIVEKGIGRFAREAADEEIIEQVVYEIPPLANDMLYPKEEWLIDLVNEELAAGRGVCVYMSQTGTRDIQDRILEIIKQECPLAKTWILKNISTDKREEKIQEMHKAGYNVMICNPQLVEVGLDMLMFPTLIFYEINYSLYTMAQAARRAWRANQTFDCKTYYPYYAGTMEQQAIGVIAAKIKAANLLYGNLDSGGLDVLAGDTNSIESELAKSIAKELRKKK